jgi:hypothetical protein
MKDNRPITNNIYSTTAASYRVLAENIAKYPHDDHHVQPFLPESNETFLITPPEIPRFCAFLRDMAERIEREEWLE